MINMKFNSDSLQALRTETLVMEGEIITIMFREIINVRTPFMSYCCIVRMIVWLRNNRDEIGKV